MYFLETLLHFNFSLPIFRCLPTSILHVLVITYYSVFLSINHFSLASLIFIFDANSCIVCYKVTNSQSKEPNFESILVSFRRFDVFVLSTIP